MKKQNSSGIKKGKRPVHRWLWRKEKMVTEKLHPLDVKVVQKIADKARETIFNDGWNSALDEVKEGMCFCEDCGDKCKACLFIEGLRK